MKLLIDTANNRKIRVGFGKKNLVRIIKVGETQKLLGLINRIIKGDVSSINEIDVNLGPGSFTGLKVGVATANALGWTLNVPVNNKNQVVIPKYQ